MPDSLSKSGRAPLISYLAATTGILLVALAFWPFHRHFRSTPGLFFILVIILVASRWGKRPALFASLLAVVVLNFFFIPPFHSLRTQEFRYVLITFVFGITAVVVGQLSARAQQRARDAEQARLEAQRLYDELQASFEQAAEAEALRRTAEHLNLAETVASAGSFDMQIAGQQDAGDGPLDVWSESLYEVLGLERGVTPGLENWLATIPADDRENVRQALDELVCSGEECRQLDYPICTADGQTRWINTRCRVLRNASGTSVRLVGAAIDVTERQRAAESLRASEQFKSVLLDCLTHDLGTPLTSIKLAAATLLRDESLQALMSARQRESLEVINEDSERLNKFIANLVSMARITAGELSMRHSAAEVQGIVAEALVRVRPLCLPSRIQAKIPANLPSVDADAHAVAQVIYTLVENACRYGLEDTPITISAERGGESEVRFAVEDRGPGIPPELRERVFDRFYRIQDAVQTRRHNSPPFTSIGMGLAIARGMIQANNGRIWIEDAQAECGTRVVFTLPVFGVRERECDFSI